MGIYTFCKQFCIFFYSEYPTWNQKIFSKVIFAITTAIIFQLKIPSDIEIQNTIFDISLTTEDLVTSRRYLWHQFLTTYRPDTGIIQQTILNHSFWAFTRDIRITGFWTIFRRGICTSRWTTRRAASWPFRFWAVQRENEL